MQLPSSSSTTLRYCLLVTFLLVVQMIQAITFDLPPNITVPAVIAFGDSIVDSGNNNYLATPFKCDFFPYGSDFMGGNPTGRFSNGLIPTDMIVQVLGIKEALPAYLDPSLTSTDLLSGVSFASGGTGYDPLTAKIGGVLQMTDQLNLLDEYMEKLKVAAGEEKMKSIIKESLYVVVGGSNDIAITYFDTPFRRSTYDVSSYMDFLLQSVSSFVQELYNRGARRIAVFNVPPLGCLPSQITIAGGIQRQCSKEYNKASVLYNSKLSSTLDRLNSNFHNAKATYIDIYTPLLDFVKNPAALGFDVVDKGCCGTGKLEVAILCNNFSVTCRNNSKYLFWDSFHPTEKGYEVLTNSIVPKYLKSVICDGLPC